MLEQALSGIPKVLSDAEDEEDILCLTSQTTSEPKDPEGDRKFANVTGLAGKEQSPDELVAEVLKILRERETFHRQLRYDRLRIKNHQPNRDISKIFEKHVDDELKHDSLSTFATDRWLRIATWWMLKVPIHSAPSSLRAALMRKLRQGTPGRNVKDPK